MITKFKLGQAFLSQHAGDVHVHSVIPEEVGRHVVMDWSTKKMVSGGSVQVSL